MALPASVDNEAIAFARVILRTGACIWYLLLNCHPAVCLNTALAVHTVPSSNTLHMLMNWWPRMQHAVRPPGPLPCPL
jgi:hypothetical protein